MIFSPRRYISKPSKQPVLLHQTLKVQVSPIELQLFLGQFRALER